jgi:threonine synthase
LSAVLRCFNCGWEKRLEEGLVYTCPRCGEPLTIVYDREELERRASMGFEGRGVWRYRSMLPLDRDVEPVSLDEGGTPLHEAKSVARWAGLRSLKLKNEGLNPTASFKDRGMTVAVTDATVKGAKKVVCASTGNTAASVAAYAARAGLKSYVLVPSGMVARGKLAQAVAYGAKIVSIKGNFDAALQTTLELVSSNKSFYLLNSVNPYRIEGQKTLAYEVWEQLGQRVPDWVVLPVGNAGNISAIWKGFKELVEAGLAEETPRMLGVQAKGASPLARAFEKGVEELEPVENPETYATAIKIGRPVSWRRALRAAKESGGAIISVDDDEILEAQKKLARIEGLFVEPASAASIAGLRKAVEKGTVGEDELVVAVLTGHGLKDPDSAFRFGVEEVEISPDDVLRVLGAEC